jgi:hypothetical protein
MRIRFALAAGLFLLAAGCSGDQATCEEARDLYLKSARLDAMRATGDVADPAVMAELQKTVEGELAQASDRFVGICKEVGAKEVLRCVKASREEQRSAECAAIGKTFAEKLYGK